MKVSEIK